MRAGGKASIVPQLAKDTVAVPEETVIPATEGVAGIKEDGSAVALALTLSMTWSCEYTSMIRGT